MSSETNNACTYAGTEYNPATTKQTFIQMIKAFRNGSLLETAETVKQVTQLMILVLNHIFDKMFELFALHGLDIDKDINKDADLFRKLHAIRSIVMQKHQAADTALVVPDIRGLGRLYNKFRDIVEMIAHDLKVRRPIRNQIFTLTATWSITFVREADAVLLTSNYTNGRRPFTEVSDLAKCDSKFVQLRRINHFLKNIQLVQDVRCASRDSCWFWTPARQEWSYQRQIPIRIFMAALTLKTWQFSMDLLFKECCCEANQMRIIRKKFYCCCFRGIDSICWGKLKCIKPTHLLVRIMDDNFINQLRNHKALNTKDDSGANLSCNAIIIAPPPTIDAIVTPAKRRKLVEFDAIQSTVLESATLAISLNTSTTDTVVPVSQQTLISRRLQAATRDIAVLKHKKPRVYIDYINEAFPRWILWLTQSEGGSVVCNKLVRPFTIDERILLLKQYNVTRQGVVQHETSSWSFLVHPFNWSDKIVSRITKMWKDYYENDPIYWRPALAQTLNALNRCVEQKMQILPDDKKEKIFHTITGIKSKRELIDILQCGKDDEEFQAVYEYTQLSINPMDRLAVSALPELKSMNQILAGALLRFSCFGGKYSSYYSHISSLKQNS